MSSQDTQSSETESLSQDVIFDVLSSKRRRDVLSLLRESEEPVQLTTLAERVAALENETTVEDLSRQARKRVYVSLYQTHVPRLADVGLVDYDPDSGEVALTELASAVDPYLYEDLDEPQWSRYYLLLAVLGAASLAAGWLEMGLFAALDPAVLATVIVVALIGLTIVHARWERRRAPQNELDVDGSSRQ